MKRRALLVAMAGLAACRRDRRPRLNVFNWSDYTAPEIVPRFEQEFGVRVRYAVYESLEELLARVMTGNSGWDVVFPTHYYIKPMCDLGLLARLRHDMLPGIRNLGPEFRAPEWDPKLEWGIPYMLTATGILYNRRLEPAPAGWADLWSERLRGRITMLDDPVDVFAACLKKLGRPASSEEPAALRAAQREAIAQKHLLRAYINAEVRDQLVAGDVLAAQMWSPTAQQALDASADLAFVYPQEGFPLFADCAVVLRESRRVELAHRFLEYLLRPEVAAANAHIARAATPNLAAQDHLAPAMRANRTLYPPAEVMARGEWFRTLSPAAMRLRDRLWTEIKSA